MSFLFITTFLKDVSFDSIVSCKYCKTIAHIAYTYVCVCTQYTCTRKYIIFSSEKYVVCFVFYFYSAGFLVKFLKCFNSLLLEKNISYFSISDYLHNHHFFSSSKEIEQQHLVLTNKTTFQVLNKYLYIPSTYNSK